MNSLPSLALITPARNEGDNLPRLLEAIVSQTIRPSVWLIVNDGSTDSTETIVRPYLAKHDWIQLLTLPAGRDRSFAAKATCVMQGYRQLPQTEIFGNLDADVSFDGGYLEFLLGKFNDDPTLGVVGTVFHEVGYSSESNSFEGEKHVPGGCQLFRRKCFEDIGGYQPVKIGVDWIAVTTARLKGWKTQSFNERVFFHHRRLGTGGRSRWGAAYLYGEKDYLLGWHPLYEVARIAFQLARHPLEGACIAAGYVLTCLQRPPRAVSAELQKFHRREQLEKLRMIARRLVTLRPLESFRAPQGGRPR